MYPAPRSLTIQPKFGFANTLIHGIGGMCNRPFLRAIGITYSRPSIENPPNPLKYCSDSLESGIASSAGTNFTLGCFFSIALADHGVSLTTSCAEASHQESSPTRNDVGSIQITPSGKFSGVDLSNTNTRTGRPSARQNGRAQMTSMVAGFDNPAVATIRNSSHDSGCE